MMMMMMIVIAEMNKHNNVYNRNDRIINISNLYTKYSNISNGRRKAER